MLRVPIEGTLLNVFVELSLNGIACADQAAFVSAFEASAANASCPAVPNCGYATYEGLCQAVQYAPMVRAVKEDLIDVNLFIFFSWVTISILILGTGRARASDGYSHLLSRHMLVAMVLGLVSLMLTLFSFMRLLLIGLRLSAPRPAAYFDQTDLMKTYELPLFCYGECGAIRFWVKLVLYLLILFALKFDFLALYASRLRDPNEVQKEQLEEAIKELRSQGWDDDAPSFYFIPAEWVRECSTKSLPRMQTLRDGGHLTRKSVPLAPAFRGGGIAANILFVSHRWEAPDQPDVDGEQLKAIKEYLEAHPNIEWVWFDYSSTPQGYDRTVMEKAEFQLMLAAIADLILTAQVLILLDGSYASRFWTLTEAWCSMQTATPDGLRPATEAERRYRISCIHNADNEHDAKGLVNKVSTKTPDEMYRILEMPDVNVTNMKDKETMLPIIQKTNEHVIETFQKYFPMERITEKLRSQGWDDDAPSFYFIPAKWVRKCSTKSLPRMQTLRDGRHLTKIKVPLASAFRAPAFRGGGITANILFVSHRWEEPDQPDVDGEQLKAIKAYLEAHPDIEWVWFDYSSMPQEDDRTVMEKAEFDLMLAAITDLYLTAHVLILLDGSYASRFWTLTEAWCSMQTVTPEGLRPATEAERRYTIKCIHNATAETTAKGLVDLVSKKTPEEMHGILKKPDVNVTNLKDKAKILPKILKIDGKVIETFQKLDMLPEPKPAVATAASSPVPGLKPGLGQR
eukprot:jgi/Chrpa1/21675/Chrysochromulina_OHIO_Genome00011508-RA